MTPLDARDVLAEIYLNELAGKVGLAPAIEAFHLAIKSLELLVNDQRYENTDCAIESRSVTNTTVKIKLKDDNQTELERIVEYLKKSEIQFYGRSSFLMCTNNYYIRDNRLYKILGYGNRDAEITNHTTDDILKGWFQIKFKDKWLELYTEAELKKIEDEKYDSMSPIKRTVIQLDEEKRIDIQNWQNKGKELLSLQNEEPIKRLTSADTKKITSWNDEIKRPLIDE